MNNSTHHVVKAAGFAPNGGFASISIDGKTYDAQQVASIFLTALTAAPASAAEPVACGCGRSVCSYDPDFGCGFDRSEGALVSRFDEPARGVAVEIKVKPLAWEERGENGNTFDATVLGYTYTIHQVVDGGDWHWWIERERQSGGKCKTLEIARAAAQADCESRIKLTIDT